MRFIRSPHVLLHWEGQDLIFEEFERRRALVAAPLLVFLLNLFGRPRTLDSVSRFFPSNKGMRAILRKLIRLGFLIPLGRRPTINRVKAWKGSFAAAYFHDATCDVRYVTRPSETKRYFLERLAVSPSPVVYKTYRGSRRVSLAAAVSASMPLAEALRRRRTVRDFAPEPTGFSDFSSVLRGTFGQTGWLDAGLLGRLLVKTSPSAGARHPIECYVLAWNVDELSPGLYHYSVKNDCLESIREGDFRKEAVRFASEQRWVGRASFLCVLTVIAGRVFWKYSSSDAYRLFLLDAGHLAQTFVLLATAHGLGPFTTAALQESQAQRFLGIDGVREFPLYLCGAGIPGYVEHPTPKA